VNKPNRATSVEGRQKEWMKVSTLQVYEQLVKRNGKKVVADNGS